MSFNAKDMTQGGQIANMRFRMFGQIANIMFYVLFIAFWVLCGLLLMFRLSWQTFINGCVYWSPHVRVVVASNLKIFGGRRRQQ